MKGYCFISSLLILCFLMSGTGTADINPETEILFTASDEVSDLFLRIDNLLADSSKQLKTDGLIGDKAASVLSDIISVSSIPGILSAVTVDTEGIIRAAEPAEYADIVGTNISSQSHIQKALMTKQPVRSDYFKAVEGFDAVTRSYPVFSEENEYLGMVHLVYDPQLLYEMTLNPVTSKTPYAVCVMDSDGMILYSSDPFLKFNTNIITDYQQSTDLKKTGEEMIQTYAGSSSCIMPSETETTDSVQSDIIWNTVDNRIIGIIIPKKE